MDETMDEGMQWIDHHGTRILLLDYRGLRGEDFLARMRRHGQPLLEIGRSHGKNSLLLLVDITDAYMDKATTNGFKESAARLRPYTRASAVAGVVGLKDYLHSVIKRFSDMNTMAFDNMDAAKEWLAEQVRK